MGDKKLKNKQIEIGEISAIREILMGDKLSEFEHRLNFLENEVVIMRSEIDHSIKDLKHVIKQNGKNLRGELLRKIVDLENRLVKGQDKTAQRLKKDRLDQAQNLSKLFLKIGKEIKPK